MNISLCFVTWWGFFQAIGAMLLHVLHNSPFYRGIIICNWNANKIHDALFVLPYILFILVLYVDVE